MADNQGRERICFENGKVVVFSDAHYWPGVESTAHRALLRLIPLINPRVVVANGDILDGARISKHARIGWDHQPRLNEELETAQTRMREVEEALAGPIDAALYWPLGNHDARFETSLANNSPEFAGVPGFTLKEHFPRWKPCWLLSINDNTIIKHRWKGGPNATLRNTLEAGTSIVTGHLHSPRVSPYTDFTGTRYGVDSGMLADPWGPQFVAYTESGSTNWRAGFAVLTYRDGKLLPPEHCIVLGPGRVAWRGEVLEV